MAIKKSELYSTLWRSCDELRGGMDASQYKNYVLAMLFIKYISDKVKSKIDSLIDIPEGCSFDDMVKLKGKDNIAEEMNKKLMAIEEANDLDGMFKEADFCDESKLGKGKDLIQTVSNLIGIFQSSGLNFGKNKASDDDLMGDAYEYLMKHFATESGKSKGQFYTPAEVSRVMAKVIGLNKEKRPNVSIYDPTCGSSSLLLRALSEAPNGAALYGQEYDVTTVGLAKMNMILHGYETYDIRAGDTLNNPQFLEGDNLKTFEYAVANPPFSQKSWLKSAKTNDKYERWNEHTIGVPPEKNGDYAFLLHIIRSLKDKGKGACILPHGVLFRGNAEADIRKHIVKRGLVKGIIGLPSNLFYGTGIPACIIIVDKEYAASRKGIFMIDAKNGFVKDGNKNRLREQDIRRIVDTWEAHEDVPHYARFVKNEEIEKNEYNLNIPRYIDAEDDEIVQNIEAHLKGGIPEHDVEQFYHLWEACPSLQQVIFKNGNRKGFFEFIPDKQNMKEVINAHPDFHKQHEELFESYTDWSQLWLPRFNELRPDSFYPKVMIEEMGNSVLEKFTYSKLVDMYDVYDQLMNYCAETLQDDLYLIESDGWKVQTYVPQPTETKKKGAEDTKPKKEKEAKTVNDLACDLLPVDYVVDEYFSTEKEKINFIEKKILNAEASLNELIEEYSDSYLDAANFTDNKLNKGNVQKKLKTVVGEEAKILKEYINRSNIIAGYKKQLKDENTDLLSLVLKKYTSLTEDEIRELVTNKWLAAFGNKLVNEIQQISHSVNSKLINLKERYEQTLPEINQEVDKLETKVLKHLEKMGFHYE